MANRLTWTKSGQTEEQLRDYLLLALIRSGVCVTLQDLQLNYEFIANLPGCWSVKSDLSPMDVSVFGTDIASQLAAIKTAALSSNEEATIELTWGNDHVFEFHVELTGKVGAPTGLLTTIIDVSEERRREKILRTLLRELSHRSKNHLAIIQSIASQTAKHSDTFDQFLRNFRGRLHSLAGSQDLITESNWEGARFRELVSRQIERYVVEEIDRISVTGDDALLSPNAALHIGLALHELIVNATAHGSLSTDGASIEISCHKTLLAGAAAIMVQWQEKIGHPVEVVGGTNTSAHFGSIVLERIVPSSVDGVAEYKIGNDSVNYSVVFPNRNNG